MFLNWKMSPLLIIYQNYLFVSIAVIWAKNHRNSIILNWISPVLFLTTMLKNLVANTILVKYKANHLNGIHPFPKNECKRPWRVRAASPKANQVDIYASTAKLHYPQLSLPFKMLMERVLFSTPNYRRVTINI